MLQATLPMSVPPPSPIRPPTNSKRRRAGAATSPAATGATTACAGDCARRCGLHHDEANGVVADAARGDGCRARAGRHHGEPGLQAGPHPRAARHAASAACDVGFSQNQAFSAANAFGAANTVSTADAVSAADAFTPPTSAPPTFDARRKPGRGRARKLRTIHARRRRAIRARKRRGSGRLPTCWPGSPAARSRNRNCGSRYFSSWRCRLRTNSVRPVRRSRLSRSALRIDCTSANASSTLWLTTI